MNKIMFKIIEKISDSLNDLCIYIADDGRRYEEHKVLFSIIDTAATKIYTAGYNIFVLGAK